MNTINQHCLMIHKAMQLTNKIMPHASCMIHKAMSATHKRRTGEVDLCRAPAGRLSSTVSVWESLACLLLVPPTQSISDPSRALFRGPRCGSQPGRLRRGPAPARADAQSCRCHRPVRVWNRRGGGRHCRMTGIDGRESLTARKLGRAR